MKTRVIKLLAALLAVSSGSAFAAPSLDATGNGFDGLSPSSGPFGRTNLTPLTTVDPNGGLKVSISANGQRIQQVDASHSFDFVATLHGNGSVNFGSLGGSFSFLLQAKPESIAAQSGTVYNYGHSELVSHMRLTFNDSGIVNSGTLPVVRSQCVLLLSIGAAARSANRLVWVQTTLTTTITSPAPIPTDT